MGAAKSQRNIVLINPKCEAKRAAIHGNGFEKAALTGELLQSDDF